MTATLAACNDRAAKVPVPQSSTVEVKPVDPVVVPDAKTPDEIQSATQPTSQPTTAPTTSPTTAPATESTTAPTTLPATQPTSRPAPTVQPTTEPASQPTSAPTTEPASQPTTEPTRPTRQDLLAMRANPNEYVQKYFEKGNLSAFCTLAIQEATEQAGMIAKIPADLRTFDNSVLALETVFTQFSTDVTKLMFLGRVSLEKYLRDEGNDCEASSSKFGVEIFTRRDLYAAIQVEPRNAGETKLLKSYLEAFESNGLKLDDAHLAVMVQKKKDLADLATDFDENIDSDTTTVTLSPAELDGVPETILSGFIRAEDGSISVPMKETFYLSLIHNAVSSASRKKVSMAYLNRAADTNLPVLKKMLKLRQDVATELGYPTWADYQLSSGRTAKDVPTVMNFLNGLKDKLSVGLQKDYDGLLKFKKEIDPSATQLDPWDVDYLEYQIKKRDFNLDGEKIREYFPADHVIDGMFRVYSTLFGVRFEEVKAADGWAPGVKLYKVFDQKSGDLMAHFYTDFIPREGKFNHAAAFPLAPGFLRPDGTYNAPVSAIVANFNPPTNDKPSLMSHDEVRTIFHEFGHIMHNSLTKVPYATLSGMGVHQDFVEAPSQMLENWIWSPEILSSLSSHYLRPDEKLPPELLKQLVAARDFDQSRLNTKQLFYASMDMAFHMTQGDFDTTQVQYQLYRDILKLEPIPGTHFEANFGHLTGYTAGYYSYMWSQVYSADMFTRFETEGLLNPTTGADYRTKVLEQGGMREPLELVKDFLGREPNNKAFLKRLGIE